VQHFTLRLKASAAKFAEKQDAKQRDRIKTKLDAIVADPFDSQHSKPLKGKTCRSARVGDFRIIFEVDIQERLVVVLVIDNRGQVYKRLD
jgi:mRNA interferase RelE/StbE